MEKAEILQKLHNSLEFAEERKELINQYISRSQEITAERKDTNTLDFSKRYNEAEPWNTVLIIALVICGFSGLLKLTVLLLFSTLLVYACIIIVIYKTSTARKHYFNSQKYKDKLAALEQQDKELNQTLGREIMIAQNKIKMAFPELASKYHTTFAINMLIEYFECGRADTLKEALDLYETDCHRMKMEDSQNQILYQIQELEKQVAMV